ncbi:MAG: diaminopimelate epimerase [Salibacteraceae bacterium]
MISFRKYEGAGNDFILIDDRKNTFPMDDHSMVERMCDRHFGIGADGLMLLQLVHGYDFRMVYFNSDGKPASMCGNGGRCITLFAKDLGLINHKANFLAVDGAHQAVIISDNEVSLQMGDVDGVEFLDEQTVYLHTGSPHVIKRVEAFDQVDVVVDGRKIRNSERFKKEGVNVNFVVFKNGVMQIRTYERGVENETLACGTGITAAAIASDYWGIAKGEVNMKAVGGNLTVRFEKKNGHYKNIWKTGPATFVFEGSY